MNRKRFYLLNFIGTGLIIPETVNNWFKFFSRVLDFKNRAQKDES